jgi:hypothetical protein
MNDKIIKILEIASSLENSGLNEEAGQLDKCAENIDFIKQAQYDGVQGYWIRNSRCWQNCYRQKRSSSPDKPIQEVWSECHGEFVDSLYGSEDSDWGKYAEGSLGHNKLASLKKRQSIDTQFDKLIDISLKDGDTVEEAVAGAIVKQCSSYTDLISEVTISILKVANSIKNKNIKDSIALVDIGDSLTKEAAGFWGGLMDTLKGGWQYGGEAVSDSKSRGALSRLSNAAVDELYQIYEWVRSYNKVIDSALSSASDSSRSTSSRLRSAANETIKILSSRGIKFNEKIVFTSLEKLKRLPYSKYRADKFVPSDEVSPGGSKPGEESKPSGEAGDSGSPSSGGGESGISLESSPRSVKEYVANNIGIAKEIATTLLRRKYETGGREDARNLLKSLGLKGASFSYNLRKHAQFVDLERKRALEERISGTRGTRKNLRKEKMDKMNGLAKRDFDQFLIAIMAKLGTINFTDFINRVVGRDRGKEGRFKPSVDGFKSPAPGPIT